MRVARRCPPSSPFPLWTATCWIDAGSWLCALRMAVRYDGERDRREGGLKPRLRRKRGVVGTFISGRPMERQSLTEPDGLLSQAASLAFAHLRFESGAAQP